ncbi:MAG: hypothetical protein IPQ08_06085 [Chitinophagaceae bacterium]|nr:hypothetical protein [Chitinophagaceae bacterium]
MGAFIKWFKHFTDNHRGITVQSLFDEFGHAGPCAYYFLIEMCAEKLEKLTGRELSAEDCRFIFKRRVVESATRLKLPTITRLLLHGTSAGVWRGFCQGSGKDQLIIIEMPILLKLLDSDLRKTRRGRDENALQTGPDKEEEKDKDKEEEKDKELRSVKKTKAAGFRPQA